MRNIAFVVDDFDPELVFFDEVIGCIGCGRSSEKFAFFIWKTFGIIIS